MSVSVPSKSYTQALSLWNDKLVKDNPALPHVKIPIPGPFYHFVHLLDRYIP